MTEEAKAARREYSRQHRSDPEKAKAAQKRYRKKHKKQINAYKRKWNAENPDKVKEYRERYWEKKAAEMKAAAESEQ